jgi:Fur family ferric uptake transcriptional regulator
MPPRTPKETVTVPPEIQTRLEAAGLRRTLATRAVLGLFLTRRGSGLTHAQAMTALTARGMDLNRVTLYRLLDRLAACGVLRREADDQRNWRFSLAPLEAGGGGTDGSSPRFECDACHRQFPLLNASESTQEVAQGLFRALARMGHHGERLELSIHGTCATCASPDGDGQPSP